MEVTLQMYGFRLIDLLASVACVSFVLSVYTYRIIVINVSEEE